MSDLMTAAAPSRHHTRVPWVTDLSIVGAALVTSCVMWLCLAQLAGIDLKVTTGDTVRSVGGVAVVLTAGLMALLAIVLLRLLEGVTGRALTIWTTIAVVVTALSLLGPLGATSAAATGVLLSLHAVVAATVIIGARRARSAFGQG